MTTTAPRRPEPAATTDRRVEDILRELAYVLHVTRKVARPLARPARPDRPVRHEHTPAVSLA